MAKSTTLRAKNTNEILYPQTKAEVVYTLDGGDVETKLQNITSTLSELESARDYKGYYPNEASLLSRYPNDIANPHDREGWYARVGDVGTSDTTMYYWDVEDNAWVRGATVEVTGASSVNGIQPDEQGNVSITAEDIPTGYTNQDGSNKNVQEVFNMLQSEHYDLESEIEAVNNKTSVLYLTNEEMEDAVSTSQLLSRYADGQVVVCNDEGNYKLGSSYKYIAIETEGNPVNAWEEITASGTEITDTITLTKEIIIPELSGEMTYEDLGKTKFSFNEETGYFDFNYSSGSTYALLKLNINLNHQTDLLFSIKQQTANNSYSYSQFSNVNQDFSNTSNAETTYYAQTKTTEGSSYEPKESFITYENFPEGNNYIYIKFICGTSGTTKFSVKLLTDLNAEEQVKTEEKTISIENDTLTINNSEIATSSNSIVKITGTPQNPIKFYELPVGVYLVDGFYKLSQHHVFFGEIVNGETQIEICSSRESTQYIIILYNATLLNNTIQKGVSNGSYFYITQLVQGYNNYPTTSADSNYFNKFATPYNGSNNQKCLSTTNTSSYTPTENYHPATKIYVDESSANVRAVKLKEDVFENPIENEITNSISQSNKNLYYNKKVGIETKNIPIDDNSKTVNLTELKINRDIINQVASSNLNGTQVFKLYAFTSYGGSSSAKQLNIQCSGGYVQSISFVNKPLYQNGEWIDDTIVLDDFGSNYVYFRYNSGSGAYLDYISYLYYSEEREVIEPIRIALYEDIQNGGGSTPSSGGMNYLGEYDDTNVYSKDDVVHYNNHFFICLGNNTVGVTPNIDMFYTEEGGVTYWRNMGYSSTYADRAIADGDGNNIATTYATKDEAGIPTLTSPVRIWDLEDGVYKLPANCQIFYRSTTDTSSLRLGTNITGILTISTGYNTIPATTVAVKNKLWTLYAGGGMVSGLIKYLGRTSEYDGEYIKIREGTLTSTISDGRDVILGNVSERMGGAYTYYLLGSSNDFYNVQRSSGCYVNNNNLYSNNSRVATQNDLGTQVTYSLDGTVLTITDK